MSEAGAPRRNIWLILSLCLNVLLVAMIAVGVVRAWQHKHELELGRAFSVPSIIAHLPSDRAAKVQAVLDAHAAKMKTLIDAATGARLTARARFTADPFDAAAYAQAQEGIREADNALQEEKLHQLNDVAKLLTLDERREIAERGRQQHTEKPQP